MPNLVEYTLGWTSTIKLQNKEIEKKVFIRFWNLYKFLIIYLNKYYKLTRIQIDEIEIRNVFETEGITTLKIQHVFLNANLLEKILFRGFLVSNNSFAKVSSSCPENNVLTLTYRVSKIRITENSETKGRLNLKKVVKLGREEKTKKEPTFTELVFIFWLFFTSNDEINSTLILIFSCCTRNH